MLENLDKDLAGDASTFGGKGKTINFFSVVRAFRPPGVKLSFPFVEFEIDLVLRISHHIVYPYVNSALPQHVYSFVVVTCEDDNASNYMTRGGGKRKDGEPVVVHTAHSLGNCSALDNVSRATYVSIFF